jgi:hypothetical protein
MATVIYKRFDGHLVSAEHHTVLTAARRAGIDFELDSGHRTMAEQTLLVHEKGVWSPANPHGAAVPSPSAPHIRIGRPDHALDVNSLDGGATRLATWIRARGARVLFTVPPEPWHMEIPLADLVALAHQLGDPLAGYPAEERRLIRAYDARPSLLRRRALRKAMTKRRKAIWKAAQQSGWGRANRRARYRSLLARTK